jgi:SAM-dependent methyltransferase
MNSAPNFDRLAHVYRWLEIATFGNTLRRCRCYFLDELRECRRALVLGDGDGRFTARLLEINPEIEIDAADASGAMLDALVERARPHQSRVHTWHGDIRDWRPSGRVYDLVVSHFFLDCLTTEEVASLAGRVEESVRPGAKWIISEFAVPEAGGIRTFAAVLIRCLYAAFGWLTGLRIRRLPCYPEALVAKGFARQHRNRFLAGILVTEVWSGPRK